MVALRLPGAMTFGVRRAARGFRDWQVWAIRPLLQAYVVCVTSSAFVLTMLAATRTDWRARDVTVYAALLACGLVAIETTRVVSEAQGTVIRDLQTVWYLAIAVTLPPAYALIASFPLTAYRLWRMRRGVVYPRGFCNAPLSPPHGCAALLFLSASCLPVVADAAGLRLPSRVQQRHHQPGLWLCGLAVPCGSILGRRACAWGWGARADLGLCGCRLRSPGLGHQQRPTSGGDQARRFGCEGA